MKEVQVDKFFSFLKNELNYSELTIKSYQLDLTDFFRFLEKSKKNYLNINNEDVRDYLKYLDSCKLKNSTISRRISTLRTFYNYLLDEGKVSSNIFKNVKNPKLEKKLPNYLNYNEMEELLNSIDTSTIEGLERRLLIEMFYSTGCRVSEIINIKIKICFFFISIFTSVCRNTVTQVKQLYLLSELFFCNITPFTYKVAMKPLSFFLQNPTGFYQIPNSFFLHHIGKEKDIKSLVIDTSRQILLNRYPIRTEIHTFFIHIFADILIKRFCQKDNF